MNWRTQTRPNGKRDYREIVPGWGAWLGRVASILAILGVVWAASARFTSFEKRFDALDSGLADKIAATIAADLRAAGYVSRDEWLLDKQTQDAATAKIGAKVDTVIDRQYRTNSMLEKLPGAKDPR